jgi:hypothetical protein
VILDLLSSGGVTTGDFWMAIGFIKILQNINVNNYSPNANSHSQQFTTLRMKSSLSAVSSRSSPGNGFQRRNFFDFRVHVFNGRRLYHN